MVWLFSTHHRSSSSSTTTTTTTTSSSSSSKPYHLLLLSPRSSFSKNSLKAKHSSHKRTQSRNCKNKSDSARTSMGSTPVVFLIPEVLERILSFVPSRDRLRARLVSRDWCRASTAHLDFSAHWVEHPVAKEYSETLQRLGVVTEFHYRLETMYYEEMVEVDVPWRRLRDRIVSSGRVQSISNGSGSSRIRLFDCRGSIHVRSRLLPLFATLPQLTVVRFEGCDLSRVTLKSLFRTCPRLQVLEVRNPSERTLNLRQKGLFAAVSSAEEEREGWHLLQGRQTRLERVVLHTVTIHPRILEDLILHSPSLNELALTQIHAPQVYDTPMPTWTTSTLTSANNVPPSTWIIDSNSGHKDSVAFVDLLASSCPKLKSLKYDATFFRGNELTGALGPLTQLQQLNIPYLCMSRVLLMAIEPRIPTMTRLDLLSGVSSMTFEMRALHEFLCSAVSLETLVCTVEVFGEQYLDLGCALQKLEDETFEAESGASDEIGEGGGAGPFISRNEVKVWGCRNLKEVHLRVSPRPDPTASLEDARRSSRILFGYLSKVCPRLTKITLERPGLDCTLDGGLCLLTGLPDLERLHVRVPSFDTLLNLWDFSWMAQEPTRLQRLADMMSTNNSRFEAAMRAQYEWLGIPDCARSDPSLIRSRLRMVGLSSPEVKSTIISKDTMTMTTTATTATAVRTFSDLSEISTASSHTAISMDLSERSKEDLTRPPSPTLSRGSGRRQVYQAGAGREMMAAIIPPEQRWPQLKRLLIEQRAGDRRNQQVIINGFIKKFRPEVQVFENASERTSN
ncbi:hypothetical protein EMPS_04708 [Entomortierella parvispora]|uniref:F-box domain-containing protein n=1 Tax=Entomortierella parvispora TaxID=205924 RepID=A0A9P3H8X5_9FUNG|nr:hypothetical protein EMPS_04708 [Entomortierella parvispora]